MNSNPYVPPASEIRLKRLDPFFRVVWIIVGAVICLIAIYIRWNHAGWGIFPCFPLYLFVIGAQLAVLYLVWMQNRFLTDVLWQVSSIGFLTAMMLQVDAGDGPRFIVGWAFWDSDPSLSNSMPAYLEWSSYLTNHLWFVPDAVIWIGIMALYFEYRRKQL